MKDQLAGKYERLRAELNSAYAQAEWSTPRIDRIANDLAALERTMAADPARTEAGGGRRMADAIQGDTAG